MHQNVTRNEIHNALRRAGFKGQYVRNNYQFGGYRITDMRGSTFQMVSYTPADSIPEEDWKKVRLEYADEYRAALIQQGFIVSGEGAVVTVSRGQKPKPVGLDPKSECHARGRTYPSHRPVMGRTTCARCKKELAQD